jgi:hypothetical protein
MQKAKEESTIPWTATPAIPQWTHGWDRAGHSLMHGAWLLRRAGAHCGWVKERGDTEEPYWQQGQAAKGWIRAADREWWRRTRRSYGTALGTIRGGTRGGKSCDKARGRSQHLFIGRDSGRGVVGVFYTSKNMVVKITRSSSEVVLQTTSHYDLS